MPEAFPDAAQLARSYFEAFDRRNRAALEALLAEDFRFTSPFDDGIERAAFFEQCWPCGDNHQGHTIERIICDSNTAFVTYYLTRKDGSASRNTEYFTTRNGKIAAVHVYFGPNYLNGEFIPE